MDSSSSFDAEWFLRIRNQPEGPSLDFKRDWENMLVDEGKRNNFIRHLIAMGNTAYRTRRKTLLVFGIEDKSREVYDLSNSYPKKRYEGVALASLMTNIHQDILNEMGKWISPNVPDFDIDYGPVIDDNKEKLVAYLSIKPGNDIYSLKKHLVHNEHISYPTGTIFIRKGSNSVPIHQSQEVILHDLKSSPYLDRDDWEKIIKISTSGEFEEAYQSRPYLPPRCENLDCDVETALFKAIENNEKIIILQGNAGTGKSYLIRRVAYRCAMKNIDKRTGSLAISRNKFAEDPYTDKRNEDEIQPPVKDFIQELEVLPTYPVPIFFSLRTNFENISRFKVQIGNFLMKNLNYKSENIAGRGLSPENFLDGLFAIPGSRWILFLDGLDELYKPDKSAEIGSWIEHELPQNVQVVIATRPNIEIFDVGQFLIKIDPLKILEIIKLTKQRIMIIAEQQDLDKEQRRNVRRELILWLKQHRGILEILRIHRALVSFTETHFSNVKLYKPEIDKGLITLEAKKNYNAPSEDATEGTSEIKPISDEKLLNSDNELAEGETTSFIEKTPGDQQDESMIIPLPEAIALRNISNYMRDEEIKRKSWLQNVKRMNDEARLWLEKKAWESEWSKNELDQSSWENNYKEYLYWNENIGFLHRKNYRKLAFISHLYQLYAAAEYECGLPPDRSKLSGNNMHVTDVVTQVKNLCAELKSYG